MIIRRLSPPSWFPGLSELDEMRRQMGRLFDALGDQAGPRTAGVFPAINVTQTEESIIVQSELPGIRPDDLEITCEDNTLSIAGERQLPHEDENASYHRQEREWGKFRRSFSFPVRVDAAKVEARYVDGVLTVELPKAIEARPKQITVKAGA
ncbi:MAG: Hsp20/alpha crystallin family protein [Acidobacteriota bacterium]|nr:MAG: Hsp20/alpha crystallin family protein [Acidobacteriota bacterium]